MVRIMLKAFQVMVSSHREVFSLCQSPPNILLILPDLCVSCLTWHCCPLISESWTDKTLDHEFTFGATAVSVDGHRRSRQQRRTAAAWGDGAFENKMLQHRGDRGTESWLRGTQGLEIRLQTEKGSVAEVQQEADHYWVKQCKEWKREQRCSFYYRIVMQTGSQTSHRQIAIIPGLYTARKK